MGYTLDEQETVIRYDKLDRTWYFETNISEHINRILKDKECYDITSQEKENGRIIYLQAEIKNLDDFRINPWAKKRRKFSEEQKQAMRERLKSNLS